MELNNTLIKRHSVREFLSKKVKWADILEAIDASTNSPAAGNIFNLKFIIIKRQETKNEIAKHAQQLWLSSAPYLILACSDETKLERVYDSRGLRYSKQQTGAAIQNFLLKITDLGLSSCWVGAYSDELIKQILKIPEYIQLEAILPVGYEKGKGKQKTKAKLENIINWEKWGQKKKPIYIQDPRTL